MMILHRPPPHLFSEPNMAASEDVEICYESLQAVCRLIRSYSRYYRYEHLPLDFVHTLSTAASILLMQRYFENAPGTSESTSSRSFALIQDAMDAIKNTHPCVKEIQESVRSATRVQSLTVPQTNPVLDWGLMDWSMAAVSNRIEEENPGVFLTDAILGGMSSSNPRFLDPNELDISK